MRSRFGSLAGVACLAVLLLFNSDRLPVQGSPELAVAAEPRFVVRGQLMPLPVAPDGSIQRARSEHFDFYTRDSGLPMPPGELEAASEQVYDYVLDRLGAELNGRIAVIFQPPSSNCGLRGFAKIDMPSITIMAGPETRPEQYLGVLAHELGHVVQLFAYGADAEGDVVLLEALATWGAGAYWNGWQGWPSFDEAVNAAIAAGQRVELDRPNVKGMNGAAQLGMYGGCQRDLFYTQWAAFVDHLVAQHRLSSIRDLASIPGRPQTGDDGKVYIRADFESVYGASLNQLIRSWLAELTG